MRRTIRSILLAVAVASSLPAAPPAQALGHPIYDCGVVAVRDIVNDLSDNWIAVMYAVTVEVEGVWTNGTLTCWLQKTDTFYNPVAALPGTAITCRSRQDTTLTHPLLQPITLTLLCGPKTSQTTFVAERFAQIFLCAHAIWDDEITGIIRTVRTNHCIPLRGNNEVRAGSVLSYFV